MPARPRSHSGPARRLATLPALLLTLLLLVAPLSACESTATADGTPPGPAAPAVESPADEQAEDGAAPSDGGAESDDAADGDAADDGATSEGAATDDTASEEASSDGAGAEGATPEGDAAPPSAEDGADGAGDPSAEGSGANAPGGSAGTDAAPASGTALAMLEELPVKGRAPKTGYDRDAFGWRDDVDRNGCDTRNDVLRRDLTQITLKKGTRGCVVLRGTLDDPYSGDSIDFDRSASTIDIDHVVALSDAWQSGAATWDRETMREFANDPLNLLAVDAGLNRQKGDGDAATWLPPKKDYRCEYVALQIAVKHRYGLWVKPAEADAMRRVLGSCEDTPALTEGPAWPGAGDGDVVGFAAQSTPAPTKAPKPAGKSSGSSSKGSSSGGSVHFKNCTAAREAGAAPVREGDPGYGKHLDRDGDGVGCE